MKLSELNTDRTLDVMCELTPYISHICSDEKLVSTLGEKMDVDQNTNVFGQIAALAGRVSELAPILLTGHRADVYGILSVLNEKTPAEISAQPFSETVGQIKEAIQDTRLIDFFKSLARQGKSG